MEAMLEVLPVASSSADTVTRLGEGWTIWHIGPKGACPPGQKKMGRDVLMPHMLTVALKSPLPSTRTLLGSMLRLPPELSLAEKRAWLWWLPLEGVKPVPEIEVDTQLENELACSLSMEISGWI